MRIPPAFPAQRPPTLLGAAHKGGNYATLGRTQGLDPAVVCGACFLNWGPCVRTPRGWRTIRSSPPGVWPWCGRAPGQRAWSIVSTSIVSAARPVLARVLPRAWTRVVGRVRSAPGPGEGAPLWCGRALSARVRVRGRVVDTDARCRHREGVVDIVRGLSTPRGGYNARWCQQRASVPISHAECQQRASVRTGRAHANNARRRPHPEPSSAVTAAHARGPCRYDCGLGEYAVGGAPKGAPPKNLGRKIRTAPAPSAWR